MEKAFVSLLIPVFNEEAFVSKLMQSIVNQDYNKELLEVIIIDGKSTDKTKTHILESIKDIPYIKLIDNPERIVPYALNYGIQQSKADIVIRWDAHSEYPENYISRLVEVLINSGADNVGGVWKIKPYNSSLKAKLVAAVSSHSFGIGNADYRFENKEIKEVDTVPYGCYRREVFEKIGLFDTDLVRNQDDEFNARLRKNGGKILLIPDLEIIYYSRPNLKKMSKMYYQYGLFKPLVNNKLSMVSSLRQLVPPLFVLYLIALFAGIFLFPKPILLLIPLFLYLLLSVLISIRLAIKKSCPAFVLLLPTTFLLVHISYGFGYLKGFLSVFVLGKKPEI